MKRTFAALTLLLAAGCGDPEPVPPPDYSVETVATTTTIAVKADPQFRSCAEAVAKGFGPYDSDDPEFGWYDNADGDGRVCER
jgi:hypothetical protein